MAYQAPADDHWPPRFATNPRRTLCPLCLCGETQKNSVASVARRTLWLRGEASAAARYAPWTMGGTAIQPRLA